MQFLAILISDFEKNLIDSEMDWFSSFIKAFNLILGEALKSIFWQKGMRFLLNYDFQFNIWGRIKI